MMTVFEMAKSDNVYCSFIQGCRNLVERKNVESAINAASAQTFHI